MASQSEQNAWFLDQLAKSVFFHQNLHEWELLEIAVEIEKIRGESLIWDLDEIGVSRDAWDKVIHRGIKPVVVFAHPEVMASLHRAVAYYRTLSMVSQKSMARVGFNTAKFEQGDAMPTGEISLDIARILNDIISQLVEADEHIDEREFDLWRGMAAGTQAQGSWQNAKGKQAEIKIQQIIKNRLREVGLAESQSPGGLQIQLKDGRRIIFSDEPDVAIRDESNILCAVEIKGGIDTAGVFERIGAAMKSLSRAVAENPSAMTILVLQRVSLTETAQDELHSNRNIINHWFALEDLLEDENKRDAFWELLKI